MIKVFKRIFLLGLLAFIFWVEPKVTFAQTNNIALQNLASIKVDELTNDQIEKFWKEAQSQGINKEILKVEAQRRKMPASELEKLINRIDEINLGSTQTNKMQEFEPNDEFDKPKNNKKTKVEVDELAAIFDELIPKPFGSDLFSNKEVSFEPNANLATPLGYVLGSGDELQIDVYGYSEDSYKVKVTPDGFVRLPNVGPVNVSGLPVEAAKKKLISKLTEVYGRINSGQTSVNVSLSKIRSIQVIVLGEAQTPGNYTLSGLSTVFNALYACGGPNKNGSYRNIKVIRNNKTVATVDVYEFLMNGNAKGNISLHDNDIVQIPTVTNRVELKGEVKRWAYYEMKTGETLADLLNYSGGFSPEAYTQRIKVFRNTGKERAVADIQQINFNKFTAQNGDVFLVSKLLNRFENRVTIKGAVFRPGIFSLGDGLTLKNLIQKADGLTEEAFMTRAIIYRLNKDNSKQMISVNLNDLLSGSATDISLQREDEVVIASKSEQISNQKVTINGLVQKPGNYEFASKMMVEDLIIAAGGFSEGASSKRIEVSRKLYNSDKKNANAEASVVAVIDVNDSLTGIGSYELQPFDIVTVYKKAGYVEQELMSVEGEVMFPGLYSISKRSERLSEIINRAGGLTAQAFSEGAVLLRPKLSTLTENIITENKLRALKKQSKDSTQTTEAIEEETQKQFDIVGIDLNKALSNPGSKYDVLIRKGDIVRIPYQKQTVLVTGEVLYPVRIVYQKGNSFKDYVNGAGGFTSKALKRRSYVIYPNGQAKATRKFLFFNNYPALKPGSEIVVPVKEDKKSISTVEVATILTSLSSLLFVVITLSK